jgi:hypothetical protein
MPTEIVDGDLDRVYVRAEKGALFECDLSRLGSDNGCWEEVDQPRERAPGVENRNTYQGEIPPPPGPVKDAYDVSWMFAERASHLRYAMLEDGSLWLWTYHVDANTNLFVLLMAGPFCGLVLAIAIILVIWLTAGVRALLGGRDRA